LPRPTIVFASPKGGAGKSTAAVLLATELVGHKAAVTVIDADPNKPLSHWASRSGKPALLTVIENATEHTVIDTIDRASTRTPFVIVDLEGTGSMIVGFAMSRAGLVIILSQGSHLDAAEAAKAIQLVELQEQAFRKKIPVCRPVHAHQSRHSRADVSKRRSTVCREQNSDVPRADR
jgi:chromosome partitioning protein